MNERPGMYARREPPQPHNDVANDQPMVHDQAITQRRAQRYYVAQYHHDLKRMHAAALQTHLPYQTQAPDALQPDLLEPAESRDSTRRICAGNSQSDKNQTTLQQRFAGDVFNRTSRVLNGVIYAGPVVELPSQDIIRNAVRDLDGTLNHTASSSSSQRRSQFSAPPRAPPSEKHRTINRPSSNGFSCHNQNKPLPIPPSTPVVEPPADVISSVQIDQQVNRPHHLELYYNESPAPAGPFCAPLLPSLELHDDQSQLNVAQPTPVRPALTGASSYLTRRWGMQPIELDAVDTRLQQREVSIGSAETVDRSPVLPDAAMTTTSDALEEQPRSSAPWYTFFVGQRTWDFDNVTDLYNELVQQSESELSKTEGSNGSQN